MPPKKDAHYGNNNNNHNNHNNNNNTACDSIYERATVVGGVTSTPTAAAAAAARMLLLSASATGHAKNSSNNVNQSASVYDEAAKQRQELYRSNAKLCRLVAKFPCLYERSDPSYAKKQVLDRSWKKIAKSCNETVPTCKERWRNIRAAFARSINVYKTNGGPNRVKPYYLHNELSFLVKPMKEGREKLKASTDDTKEELEDDADEVDAVGADKEVDEEVDESAENHSDENAESDVYEDEPAGLLDAQAEMTSDFEAEPPQQSEMDVLASSHKRTLNDVEAIALDDRSFKRCKLMLEDTHPPTIGAGCVDPDVKFFDALLPDMKVMNARQKIIFKRKIYQAMEEVLETTTDFPHMNVLKQNLSATAKSIINDIAGYSEMNLQLLHAFMQGPMRQPATNRTSVVPRAQNGAPSSSHVPTSTTGQTYIAHSTPLTVPRAQQNGHAHAHMQLAASSRTSVAPNDNRSMASPWEQLLPITVKTEVDDVDVV